MANRLLAALSFLVAGVAVAMDTPVLGGSPGSPSAASSNFNYIHTTAAWDSNAALRQSVIPFDLNVTTLSVVLQTAPGAGTQRDFVIRKNGSDTVLGCSIIDTAVSCSSSTAVAFSKGDLVDIKSTPINTPASASNVFLSVMVSAGIQQALLISASNSQPSNSATVFAPPSGSGHHWDQAYTFGSGVVPAAGKIKKLYVSISAAPGAAKTRTFTYYLNGSATGVTCDISGAAATTCEDSANSFDVVAGDTIGLAQIPSGTPAAARATWAAQFEPTTDGESFVAFGSSVTLPTSGTNFTFANGVGSGITYTTEPSRRFSMQAARFSHFYGILGEAPGSGKSYAFTLRNAGGDSAVTFTIADLATSGSDTSNNFTPSFGALTSLKVVASGTPTSSFPRFGYKMYVAPTVTTRPQRSLLGVGQ